MHLRVDAIVADTLGGSNGGVDQVKLGHLTPIIFAVNRSMCGRKGGIHRHPGGLGYSDPFMAVCNSTWESGILLRAGSRNVVAEKAETAMPA